MAMQVAVSQQTPQTSLPNSFSPPPAFSKEAGISARTEREEVILTHLPLVRIVAQSVQRRLPPQIEVDDLISAGTLGLLDAVQRFNPQMQAQFKSYAQIRIRGAILDSLRADDWSPRDVRRQGRAMRAAMQSLSLRYGRNPNEQEIADEMGISLGKLQELSGELQTVTFKSLNEDHGESGEEEMHFIAAPEAESPWSLFVQEEEREVLRNALAELPEREALVLALSFFEELTLKEIGRILGVVESRASQIRATALAKLRRKLIRSGSATLHC